jgi:hypothetical protein
LFIGHYHQLFDFSQFSKLRHIRFRGVGRHCFAVDNESDVTVAAVKSLPETNTNVFIGLHFYCHDQESQYFIERIDSVTAESSAITTTEIVGTGYHQSLFPRLSKKKRLRINSSGLEPPLFFDL